MKYVIVLYEYDSTTNTIVAAVGPFDTRRAAKEAGRAQAGRKDGHEWDVRPLRAPRKVK